MTGAVDVSGRGVRVSGRSVGVGSAIPDSDDFQDGSISSVWGSRAYSVDESNGDLTVTYSNHQGDYLPSSGNSWELVFQKGDFEPFRVEAQANNAFNGTDDQKVHIGIEGGGGTRWAGGWSDEGTDTFRGFEYVGGENIERDGGAQTSNELWIALEWDGSTLTLETEHGSSFGSWSAYGSVSPSFTAPIKVGLVGNNNTIAWRDFSVQSL